jgi:hypothetical protein
MISKKRTDEFNRQSRIFLLSVVQDRFDTFKTFLTSETFAKYDVTVIDRKAV